MKYSMQQKEPPHHDSLSLAQGRKLVDESESGIDLVWKLVDFFVSWGIPKLVLGYASLLIHHAAASGQCDAILLWWCPMGRKSPLRLMNHSKLAHSFAI